MTTKTTRPPSPKMLEAARLIHETRKRDGRAPSFRELADGLGVTLARATDIVRVAKQRGLLADTPGEPRSLRVVDVRALRPGRGG